MSIKEWFSAFRFLEYRLGDKIVVRRRVSRDRLAVGDVAETLDFRFGGDVPPLAAVQRVDFEEVRESLDAFG